MLAWFYATSGPRGVVLAWETVREKDNVVFLIERGPSAGGPWQYVGRVVSRAPGAGMGERYTWVDAPGNADERWYRLLSVNTQAVREELGVVSMREGWWLWEPWAEGRPSGNCESGHECTSVRALHSRRRDGRPPLVTIGKPLGPFSVVRVVRVFRGC